MGATRAAMTRWGCVRDATADRLIYMTRNGDPHSQAVNDRMLTVKSNQFSDAKWPLVGCTPDLIRCL